MKKKLFFWTNYYKGRQEVGTTSKIVSEIETLRLMGFEVYYTAYLNDGVGVFDNSDYRVAYRKFGTNNKFLVKAFRRESLVKIAREFISDNEFDFCLLRINYIGGNYYGMLRDMKKKSAFVMMESLSYYPNMSFGNVKKASYFMIYNSLKKHRNDLKNVVDLMLTEGEFDGFYGIPTIEFGMGIDVEKYKTHVYRGSKDEVNMIMVGCTSVYHGTDRIIRSLKKYVDDGGDNVKLHLVGDVLEKDKKLINNLKLNDVIKCYGFLVGNELDEVYDCCNVALGPLAQHRINKKDTGLKTKEYFARGIPYVYTGCEGKLEHGYPYIMQVTDDEELIDLHDVVTFYNNIKDKGAVEDMRETAREVFSWRGIFERVFDKVESVKG